VEYRVRIHQEDGTYWADVESLPGCFASGRTLDELKEAVVEAITMYLSDDEAGPTASGQVDEMRVLVGA